MTDNWYIILELEFDPNPVVDETTISERIEEKKQFWAVNLCDSLRGVEYQRYLRLIPIIKKDMIGDANIRAELIEDARQKTYSQIDKKLKKNKKAELSKDTIEKIAADQKISVDTVKKRAQALGFVIVSVPEEDSRAIYEKYFTTKPRNAEKYESMEGRLQAFGVNDLYEFLFQDTLNEKPQNLSCETLRQRARELKACGEDLSEFGSRLCEYCMECFKNESEKHLYDEYLDYICRKAILDGLKRTNDIDGGVSKEKYNDCIGQLTELFKNRDEAKKLLKAFCKIENITVFPISDKNSAGKSGKKHKSVQDKAYSKSNTAFESVKIRKIRLVNEMIFICIDSPANCSGFVVLYRRDRFPNDINDPQAMRKYISVKQFLYDSGLSIDSNGYGDYYFSIFAEYKVGRKLSYSSATNSLFSIINKQAITYGISVSKKKRGGETVNITFEGPKNKFTLPDIEVLSAKGRAPMFRKSGALFYSIPRQEVSGVLCVSIPIPKDIAKETYIKPFFRDENLIKRYILKLKLGFDNKIS